MHSYLEKAVEWLRRKVVGRMGYIMALAAVIFALLLGTGC